MTEELTKAFEGGNEVEDEDELSLEELDRSTHTASLNENDQISLDLRLVDGSTINSTSAISINAGSTATNVLGLPATPSTSTGASPLDVILLDTSGQTYQIELETGNDKSSPHPAKLMLSQNGIQMGTILPSGGRITGLIDATNSRPPRDSGEM